MAFDTVVFGSFDTVIFGSNSFRHRDASPSRREMLIPPSQVVTDLSLHPIHPVFRKRKCSFRLVRGGKGGIENCHISIRLLKYQPSSDKVSMVLGPKFSDRYCAEGKSLPMTMAFRSIAVWS